MSGRFSGDSSHGTGARRRRPAWMLLLGILSLGALMLQPALLPSVLADPVSPLTVTKTANPSPVASGQQLTYTIGIQNAGGAKVTNVVMTDQVNGVGVIQQPPALPQLVITSSKGGCTQGGPNGNVVTCQVGSLGGGEAATITIRGQVTASNGTTLNNTASVSGTKSAQNFTTNASVSVLVQGGSGSALPDLTINKTGPTSVTAGDPLTYTLTVNNIGTANAANIKVVDTLPAGVTFDSTSTTSLFACSPTGSNPVTVTCTGGAVNQGQNGTIAINGHAPATAGQITNTAVVDPDNAIAESNELNNTSAAVYTTVGANPPPSSLLSIVKTDNNPNVYPWSAGAGPDPVTPGQVLTYVIQVQNRASGTNSRADDVVVTDGTQGLDSSSITASQVIANGTVGNTGGCVVIAPQVRCSTRSLNAGGTMTVTIRGTVLSSAGATIFNTATVTGNIKNTGVSNTASESTTVRPAVDLTITKADSPDPVCARSWPTSSGGQHLAQTPNPPGAPAASGSPSALLAAPACLGGLRYDLVVGNSGISDANGVVVRDPLPEGTILDSYENPDGNFTCGVDAANVVTCTGDVPGALPPASQSLRHIALLLVAPPSVGSITNTVTVDPNNAIFEPDETNNTATAVTAVKTGVDLVAWKGDGGQDPPSGSGDSGIDPPGDGAPTLVPGTATNLGDGYDPIATRGTETYTIYVDDVGPQDTAGITVRDTLPADTVFLSAVPDASHGFTCSEAAGVVTCVGGHLLGTESEFYDAAGAAPTAPGDDVATIKIRVFARHDVGTMHNEVRVDPDNTIPEINELNNIATDDTTVTVGNAGKGAFNQLTVSKTQVSPAGTVATNGILVYNLHVSNLGTDPVSNIVLTDTLPSGTRFIEAKDTSAGVSAFFCAHDGSPTGGVVTCTGGDLDGSINTAGVGATSRDVTVKVFAPGVPGTATNLATVDPNNIVPEGNEFDNDAQLATTVGPCVDQSSCTADNAVYELTLAKSQDRDPIARNGLETYTLTVTNLGSDPVSGVRVDDTLPAGSRFLDARDGAVPPPDPSAFTCSHDGSPTGGTVTCMGGVLDGTGDTLGAGVPQTRTIVIRAFMPDTPGIYTNRAVVDPLNAVPEGNEFNNEASIQTDVRNGGPHPWIDLKVTKTQSLTSDCNVGTGATCVEPGQVYFYTLHVENLGEADAFNVSVRDILPPHVGFLSALDSAVGAGMFVCTFSDPNIDCTGATIAAGSSRDITIRARAPIDLESLVEPGNPLTDIRLSYTNQATVDPANAVLEGDESNNASSVDTTVRPKNNLTLTKDGPGSATQNDTTTYTITVTNTAVWGGGSTALGVKIVDPLPVGLIPLGVQADPGNFICQVEESPVNLVTCIGDLGPTEHVTITIKAFVTQDGGELDNEACVDPDHTISESNEVDNCKTAIGQVQAAAPDLLINKTADKGSVTADEALTYTLTVSNVGTADTTGEVDVSDTVPPELAVTGINPDDGWDCSASSGNTVSCSRPDLPAGGSTHIQVQTSATGTPLSDPFTNTASVSGGGETNTSNDSDSVTTSVGGAAVDLAVVSITDNPDPVNHGDPLTYTAIVQNTGTSQAPGAVVRVVLPASGVPVPSMAVAATNGFSCSANTTVDASGRTFDCVGTFDAAGGQNDSTTITAQMTVDQAAPPPTQLAVTVTADPDGAFTEADELNNTKTETTTISGSVCSGPPCVDLLAIAVGTPITVAGGVASYTATVTNVGQASVPDSPAWSIDLSFTGVGTISLVTPPAGVTCTPQTPLSYRCTSVAGSSDPMDLAAGDSLSFTVLVANLQPSGSFGLFQVVADPTSVVTEADEGNNTGIWVTAIQ